MARDGIAEEVEKDLLDVSGWCPCCRSEADEPKPQLRMKTPAHLGGGGGDVANGWLADQAA